MRRGFGRRTHQRRAQQLVSRFGLALALALTPHNATPTNTIWMEGPGQTQHRP